MAREFIKWMHPEPAGHWLEVGCGTGALTSTICDHCNPASVVACDSSESFVAHAAQQLTQSLFLRFGQVRIDVLLGEGLSRKRWNLHREWLRRRRRFTRHVGLRYRTLFDREHGLARRTFEDVDESELGGLSHDVDVAAVLFQRQRQAPARRS